MAGESPEQRTEALRSSRRAATCRRPGSPAGRTAGDQPNGDPPGERRAPAAARLRRRGGGAGRRRRATWPTTAAAAGLAGGPGCRSATSHRRSPPRSWTPAGSRSSPADRVAGARGVDQGADGHRRGARRRRSRPRRGTPLALALAGSDGRTVAAEGPEASDALRRLVERPAIPLVAHEVKPILVARFAEDLEGRPRRSRSTPRSRRTSSTRRCAARRSRTSSPRTSTRSCHRPTELPATARAGLEALSAMAVREPLERRLVEASSTASSARSSCRSSRSSPGWRRSASPSIARRSPSSTASSAERDRAPRARDLRRRRARVQPRQPQAARAGPVLRAQPAEGQAHEDRLLDGRIGAGGPPAGAPDDRQAPRVAGLHEAPIDLRRGAAEPDRRGRRPAPHDVPPGRGRDGPPVVVRPEPPEHPDPDRRSGGGSGGRSWPASRT